MYSLSPSVSQDEEGFLIQSRSQCMVNTTVCMVLDVNQPIFSSVVLVRVGGGGVLGWKHLILVLPPLSHNGTYVYKC
jgi:hypothetical protein